MSRSMWNPILGITLASCLLPDLSAVESTTSNTSANAGDWGKFDVGSGIIHLELKGDCNASPCAPGAGVRRPVDVLLWYPADKKSYAAGFQSTGRVGARVHKGLSPLGHLGTVLLRCAGRRARTRPGGGEPVVERRRAHPARVGADVSDGVRDADRVRDSVEPPQPGPGQERARGVDDPGHPLGEVVAVHLARPVRVVSIYTRRGLVLPTRKAFIFSARVSRIIFLNSFFKTIVDVDSVGPLCPGPPFFMPSHLSFSSLN